MEENQINIENENIKAEDEEFSNDVFVNIDDEIAPEKDESKFCLNFKNKNSFIDILNICASAFGSGCLSLPYSLQSIGIINSLLVFIFISLCIYYSLDLLRRFVVETKYYSFSLMTKLVLGKKWLIVYAIASSILYLIYITNYLNICYSIFQTVFKDDNDKSMRYIFGILYILITYAIEVFLCLFTRNKKRIHLISISIIIVFSIFIIAIIIGGIKGIIDFGDKKFESKNFFNPFSDKNALTTFNYFINSSLMYIYSFLYHSTFPTFLGNANLSGDNSKKINIISFCIICGTYLIISFFGYLLKEKVPYQILLEEMKEKNTILKIIAFIYLFGLVPLRFITIRDGYECLIGEKKFNYKIDIKLTLISLFIANLIIFFNQVTLKEGRENIYNNNELGNFLNMFASLLGVIIAFLLPSINYAAINGKTKKKSIIGFIISTFFIILGIIASIFSFFSFEDMENTNA